MCCTSPCHSLAGININAHSYYSEPCFHSWYLSLQLCLEYQFSLYPHTINWIPDFLKKHHNRWEINSKWKTTTERVVQTFIISREKQSHPNCETFHRRGGTWNKLINPAVKSFFILQMVRRQDYSRSIPGPEMWPATVR